MIKKQIGYYTAISIVIASMVGTGVFTSLGFQVLGLHTGVSVLFLWFLGGVLALCGSFSYAQLAMAFPGSGGEYNFLSKLFHPAIGFASGLVSTTVGFSAPAALSALALAGYLNGVFNNGINEKICAIIALIFIGLLHMINLKIGARFQTSFTIIKVFIILIFIVVGLFSIHEGTIDFGFSNLVIKEIFSPSFAISMMFVSYAYSGWNASCYLADEIENEKVNLPKSLIHGTLIVTALYVFLNFVFLLIIPQQKLQGCVEVGLVAANMISPQYGYLAGLVISLLLVSSISSYFISGPFVANLMGKDFPILKIFSVRNKGNSPYMAILFQLGVSLFLVITSTFENVLTYVGFTLNLFAFLTVLGLLIKWKDIKNLSNYKTPLFPIPSFLFLLINLWIMFLVCVEKPIQSLAGLATVAIGTAIFFFKKSIYK